MIALPRHCDVLVVGAGPTGLALAIRLRQLGVDCLLIDRLEEPMPGSRAVGLQPRSLEILHGLGVLAAIQANSVSQTIVNLQNAAGSLLKVDFSTLETPFPEALNCPQDTLEKRLEAHYLSLGGRLLRSVQLLSFSQDDDRVNITLQRQGEGPVETSAALLVGCDGAHSSVRHEMGVAFESVNEAAHFLLADVDIDWPLDRHNAYGFLLADDLLVALPLVDGWRLMISASLDRETDMDELDLSVFRQRLQEALGYVPVLSAPRWLSRFSIKQRLASRYRLNRVLLAGDACHLQSPLGAQGMNAGIADAFNLAWKIGLFLQGVGGGALLDSYQQERRPVAESMLRGASRVAKISSASNRLLRFSRDATLHWLDKRPTLLGRLARHISQLAIHYRGSALVGQGPGWKPQSRGNYPQPGDRFPSGPLSMPSTGTCFNVLDLLCDPRHHLLIQMPESAGHADIVAAFGLADRVPSEFGALVRTVIIVPDAQHATRAELKEYDVAVAYDKGGYWAERLPGGGLWLLRPDGHLGYRGALVDAHHLLKWLRAFFRCI